MALTKYETGFFKWNADVVMVVFMLNVYLLWPSTKAVYTMILAIQF